MIPQCPKNDVLACFWGIGIKEFIVSKVLWADTMADYGNLLSLLYY
tara:strand:- start:155 stop:292 length:138 start_codon:yes stop_codon:yes gene_type:complete